MVEPYESALDDIPGASPYPRTSRYNDVEIGIHTQPDGTQVRYAKRRLLPPLPRDPDDIITHTVTTGERADLLAQRYLGASDQWWQIADANPVLDPNELADEPGEEIVIPLPGGFLASGAAPGLASRPAVGPMTGHGTGGRHG